MKKTTTAHTTASTSMNCSVTSRLRLRMSFSRVRVCSSMQYILITPFYILANSVVVIVVIVNSSVSFVLSLDKTFRLPLWTTLYFDNFEILLQRDRH